MSNEMKCPVPHGGNPSTSTETASPLHGAVTHNSRKITRNEHWWPDRLDLAVLHQNTKLADPMGQDFDYAAEFKTLDLDAVDQGPPRPDDRLAELVARGLRPLRPVLHPHGMAQRRHVPHPRWPRRRRHGHAAFCAAQQLAGQCQPRQGSPPAMAHQAEVRQEDLLGRSHDPYRQRRARLDGSQDLRLRRRSR